MTTRVEIGSSWQSHAACLGASAIMFEPDIEKTLQRKDREARAKEICARCVVIEPCLERATTNEESGAVWGGMNDQERTVYKLAKNQSKAS